MTIQLLSSPGLWSAANRRSVERQPAVQDIPAPETIATATSATSDSAGATGQNMPGRQNVPGALSDDTRAALLSLQEADAAVASAGTPDPTRPAPGNPEIAASRVFTSFKATPVAELPEDRYQSVITGLETMLEAAARGEQDMIQPDASYLASHPALQTYATVTVGGKVVATIDNQGVVSTSNEVSSRFADRISNELNGTNGPDLARVRAQEIAALLGGKVVTSSTAMTQRQFNANPIDPDRLRPSINVEAMKQNPLYQQLQDLRAQRTAYLAQQAAAQA
jgi:hypothetical protein